MKPSGPDKPLVAVLGGAGAMGRAVVFDLARSGHLVRLLDRDLQGARRIARRFGTGRVTVAAADARDPLAVATHLQGAAAVINAAPYSVNVSVMTAALQARCHYLDLGGLFHTTRVQLTYHTEFQRAGLLAVVGMGGAPGIVNVLARAAADPLPRVFAIRVYNGGADFTRYPAPAAFGLSPATVLNELTLPPMVFTKGRFRAAEPGTGGEDFLFELGPQRVHSTLHSEVATLPLSYRAKGIRECWCKIAYDPELIERMRLLIELGLTERKVGPHGIAPRDLLLDCFARLPPPPDFIDDRDSLAVVVEGEDATGPLSVRYDLTAGPQHRPPLSAVARNTGFPAAIVAQMIVAGTIRERGVLPPERCVPVPPFLAALARRGLRAKVTVTRPA
jgi:lysine 6-dehydrogenase